MDQTVHQIEAHINTTREHLGSNLQELERKVDAVSDWRAHFQARPLTLLGVAFAGGVALATTLRGRRGQRTYGLTTAPTSPLEPHAGSDSRKYQALETWDNIKGALIGLAAERFKDFVGDVLPGFNEQFQRTEQRAASVGALTALERPNPSTPHG
jgi:hypothetical protein